MKTSKRIYLSFFALLCAALACSAPVPEPTSAPVFDADAINTFIVQTAESALTLSAVPDLNQFVTPSLTFTLPPTLTPTQTETPTPAYTFTPAVPILSVSVDTNCRSGPGKVYDYKGALLVGESAEVFGRDAIGHYWYIRNPDKTDHYCWVWGEYATIFGNVSFLPIHTPPPTPTATYTPSPTPTLSAVSNFRANYTSMDSCAGWWLEFKLKNIGTVDLKSVEIVLFDKNAGKTVANLTDGFTDINGCITSATKDTLSIGTSLIISAPAFTFDPTGHEIQAKITTCSKKGLNGLCVTQKFKFIP